MKHLFTFTFFLAAIACSAQQSLLISYNLKSDSASIMANTHIQNLSMTLNPMVKYMVNHIQESTEIRNYIGVLGLTIPKPFSEMKISSESILDVKNEDFSNGYFLDEQKSELLTSKNGDVYSKDWLLFEQGSIRTRHDTSLQEDLFTGEMEEVIVNTSFDLLKDANTLGFTEYWTLGDGPSFKKEVKMISVGIYSPAKLYNAVEPIYNLKTTDADQKAFKSTLLKENVVYDVNFFENTENSNEEYWNSTFSKELKDEMLYHIFRDIIRGHVKVVDSSGIEVDANEFFETFTRTDTALQEDLFTGDQIEILVVISTKIQDILAIRFTEDWYTDKNGFDLIKKVKSIQLLVAQRSSIGEYMGNKLVNDYVIKFPN